jgi:hypothetical protein
MVPQRHITLKHLFIDGQKQIGLKFYRDKIIDLCVEALPNIRWSKEFSMPYILNTKQNLELIFKTFRGVARLNCNSFFGNKPILRNGPVNIDHYRKRKIKDGYRPCPEEYLQKPGIKRYSLNTAKTYINCFEAFLQFYKGVELTDIDENDIREYLQTPVKKGLSNSYINQSTKTTEIYTHVANNLFSSIKIPIDSLFLDS